MINPADELAKEFAKELAKQVPLKDAYNDALSPSAKVAGTLMEDVAKTIHLALAPLQLTAALQDRFRRFLDKSIRQVPDKKRIPPAPQILGPALEGIRYEAEGSDIDEMFSQLLARAADTDRVGEAHPAYPQLIKQLSSDEAKILQLLARPNFSLPFRRQTGKLNAAANRFEDYQTVEETFPKAILNYPGNLDFYIEHLWSLGLAGLLRADEKPIYTGGRQTGTDLLSEYRLTPLGQRFMTAVQSPECQCA